MVLMLILFIKEMLLTKTLRVKKLMINYVHETNLTFSIAFVIPQAYRQQYGHVVRRELF